MRNRQLRSGNKNLSILRIILGIMGLKEYLNDPTLYKNLRDLILLVVGSLLLILGFVYMFFIRKTEMGVQDFIILIGYIFAYIAGTFKNKKD